MTAQWDERLWLRRAAAQGEARQPGPAKQDAPNPSRSLSGEM
jgi:hypothetical protein